MFSSQIGIQKAVLATWLLAGSMLLGGCLPGDGTTGGPGVGIGTPPVEEVKGAISLGITDAQVVDGRPVVEFSVLDPTGLPITDLSSASFTFAKLAPRSRYGGGFDWINYLTRERDVSTFNSAILEAKTGDSSPLFGNAIQGNTENNGVLENLGNGTYRYTYNLDLSAGYTERTITGENVHNLFHVVADAAIGGTDDLIWWADGTTLPRGVSIHSEGENTLTYTVEYDPELTHRVGMQLGGGLVANAWFDFIPATGERVQHGVDATRDIVSLQSCNSCHDGTLAKHGGNRVEPNYCVTCHNPGSIDPVSGRSIDFKQLIHKVHRGSALPSVRAGVPYFIRGNDFSHLRFPQMVHENQTIAPAGNYTAHGFDAENDGPLIKQISYGIDNCVKCHMGQESYDELILLAGSEQKLAEQQLAVVTPDGDNWLTGAERSVEVCASCHDSVYWWREDIINEVAYQDTLPQMLAERFGASTEGYLGDWRTGHQRGWIGDTPHATLESSQQGPTYAACGGCHNGAITGDATNIGMRGIGETGNNRVRMARAHLYSLRAGLRQDQLKIQFGPEQATLDRDNGILSFRLRVRDEGRNTYLTNGVNASYALGFVIGWMEEGFDDFTHSSNPGGPGRTTDIGCNAACWENNTGTASVVLSGPSAAGYYTVTLTLPLGMMDSLPEHGVGTVAVQGAVVPTEAMGDPLATGSADVWNDARTPVVNALHKTTNFPIGNGTVFERRQVVDVEETCRSCHIRFAKHGGNRRNNPELCVMCHNPNNTDVTHAARRGNEGAFDGKLEESKDFKHLIHSVHRAQMGEDGIQLRAVVFGGPLPGWEGEAHFPGSVGNCLTCHVNDSYKLENLPANAIGRTVRSFDWDTADMTNQGGTAFGSDNNVSDLTQHQKLSPIASVCTSCHTDREWFEGHIQQRGGVDWASFPDSLDPMGEACIMCHGTGGEMDISRVHDVRARQ